MVIKEFSERRMANTYYFSDQDIRIPKNIDCKVGEEDFPSLPSDTTSSHRMVSGNCVEIYVECDYKSYLDNGSSVSSTELWVASCFMK
jgi:hypothetical protein